MPEPLLFEMTEPGRRGFSLPGLDVPEKPAGDLIPAASLRSAPADLPELSEPEVMRHFIRLSLLNHHVDKGFYPLGSCTMKYNPKVNENTAKFSGFSQVHPLQDPEGISGILMLMGDLARSLCEISGMDAVTLQPAAGAHGEMTGIKIIRAYHERNGNPRTKIILPDSAHGTNPASAAISGYRTVQIRSNAEGLVDLEDLKKNLDEQVACLMLTNPNTLGLFESRICEISRMVHEAGALLYMDGANLNALLGIVRPGEIGFDVLHFNLHKTFSSPHGGGGPGSGPVGVRSFLRDFLPVPILVEDHSRWRFEWNLEHSIGKLQGFYGNVGVMVRAYTYIRMLGEKGLKQVSRDAILNANYLMRKLEGTFDLPHAQHHMHEFVLSGDRQKKWGIKTLDMAKRLLDFGFHAPTVYFPLIVHEAMMIEPTETESLETLDAFADVMKRIAMEAEQEPDILKQAPLTTPVSRLDEASAARDMDVCYRKRD
ncbi:aminomethyl-transferring glycine dehydrogenase subunit GcvPB [bacterium]|nr:aminomethyl-transferring glycine dehydrogenase subunit GcvPB [bacterium]